MFIINESAQYSSSMMDTLNSHAFFRKLKERTEMEESITRVFLNKDLIHHMFRKDSVQRLGMARLAIRLIRLFRGR